MGWLEKLGFKTLGPLQDMDPKERAKTAIRHLNDSKDAESKNELHKSLKILENSETPIGKLWEAERSGMMAQDGVAWLNLVLAICYRHPSVLSEFPDLAMKVRNVIGTEKGKRDKMPHAKQLLFDAVVYEVEHKNFFNRPPEVANDNPLPENKDEKAA